MARQISVPPGARVKIERIRRAHAEGLLLLGFVVALINEKRSRGEDPDLSTIFDHFRFATGSTATYEQLYRRWHHYATEAGLIQPA